MRQKASRKLQKKLSVNIDVELDSSIHPKQIAKEIGKSLKMLGPKVSGISKVKIRTTAGSGTLGNVAGGYETRLWEKATCNAARKPERGGRPI